MVFAEQFSQEDDRGKKNPLDDGRWNHRPLGFPVTVLGDGHYLTAVAYFAVCMICYNSWTRSRSLARPLRAFGFAEFLSQFPKPLKSELFSFARSPSVVVPRPSSSDVQRWAE